MNYVCSICGRSIPEDVMYTYSPGGLVKIHECPECHDRGENSMNVRRKIIGRAVKAEKGGVAL